MLEFVALIIFILATFIVFQKFIVRGFTGRWKGVGDMFGEGRIYDPKKTVECAANAFFVGQAVVWYNEACFKENCLDDCLEVTRTLAACNTCLTSNPPTGCHTVYCDN